MSEIPLNPADDEQYLNILFHDTPVVLEKTGIKPGVSSPLKMGSTKEGKIKDVRIGRPLNIEGRKSGSTTAIETINVDDAVGRIHLMTRTSVYDVKMADKSKEHRRVSLLFLRRGYLDFHDRMPDGFYDGGRHMKYYLKDGKLKMRSPREIVILDSVQDPAMKIHLAKVTKLMEGINDLETKIRILALFVSNVLGGSQLTKQQGINIGDLSDKNVAEILAVTQEGQLPLGYLNYGVCRHRALLFKFLADRLGIPSRLVRGNVPGAHQWNVVLLHGKPYIVDVMYDPTRLIDESSQEAKNYKREGIKGIPGGFGGRSVGYIPG
jgi:hypothetical protein